MHFVSLVVPAAFRLRSHGAARIDDSAAHHAGLDAERSERHHRASLSFLRLIFDAHGNADRDSPHQRRHREGKPRRRSVQIRRGDGGVAVDAEPSCTMPGRTNVSG
jgi:hypothetical protein